MAYFTCRSIIQFTVNYKNGLGQKINLKDLSRFKLEYISHEIRNMSHRNIYCLFPIIPEKKTERFPSLLFVLVRIKSWMSIAYCDIDYYIQVKDARSKYNVLLCWK